MNSNMSRYNIPGILEQKRAFPTEFCQQIHKITQTEPYKYDLQFMHADL